MVTIFHTGRGLQSLGEIRRSCVLLFKESGIKPWFTGGRNAPEGIGAGGAAFHEHLHTLNHISTHSHSVSSHVLPHRSCQRHFCKDHQTQTKWIKIFKKTLNFAKKDCYKIHVWEIEIKAIVIIDYMVHLRYKNGKGFGKGIGFQVLAVSLD